jgi:hypothetical protein
MVSTVAVTRHTMQIGKAGFELGRKLVDSAYTLEQIVTKQDQAIKDLDGFGVIDIFTSARSSQGNGKKYSAALCIDDRGLLESLGPLNLCVLGARP